ncbi:hypothetical protein [Caballeronia sp. BR00000012568055]|uniref:hypothetical protein n=1 Tax=Caballeronia sp. BR00000012568055 TaxID=2918761 RepID=UPI0023F84803|nr:hypothetical protein [Caballeronia sp. BR00000012568055]
MLADSHWIEAQSQRRARKLEGWISECRNLVALELGAGHAIPTVDKFGEHYARRLTRVNPRDFKVPQGRRVGVADTALHFLERVDQFLDGQPDRRAT